MTHYLQCIHNADEAGFNGLAGVIRALFQREYGVPAPSPAALKVWAYLHGKSLTGNVGINQA